MNTTTILATEFTGRIASRIASEFDVIGNFITLAFAYTSSGQNTEALRLVILADNPNSADPKNPRYLQLPPSEICDGLPDWNPDFGTMKELLGNLELFCATNEKRITL